MPQARSGQQLLVPSTVVGEALDGELVLLNLESGLYFGLNRVGTMIWESLASHGDLEAAVGVVVASFPTVEPAQARRDAERLVQELLEAGLLQERSSEAVAP